MKYSILILSFTLCTLFSCQKKYTCKCTDGAITVVYTEEIEANSQTEARDICRNKGTECDL